MFFFFSELRKNNKQLKKVNTLILFWFFLNFLNLPKKKQKKGDTYFFYVWMFWNSRKIKKTISLKNNNKVNTYFPYFVLNSGKIENINKFEKKWKPQKSEAEPPILIYVFKKRLARLNFVLAKKKKLLLNYVWLSFWEFIFWCFQLIPKKGKNTKRNETPKVRSWTPNTNLCIPKNSPD